MFSGIKNIILRFKESVPISLQLIFDDFSSKESILEGYALILQAQAREDIFPILAESMIPIFPSFEHLKTE